MGLLDGKVAVITGAGGGLGRCHALALAREGAKIVVNDLGGTRDGTGAGSAMADQVVEEIKGLGGEAVPNYDSVATLEGAANIMKTAVDAFGRIDILVNNAGILRDKTLLKMDESMWDSVIAVHLKGTYACTQSAVRIMKEQGTGGRIINTTSYAGLKGNFGQTNYAAAKGGIYSMTLVWGMELARYGITVNAIAPLAKTRMTEDIDMIPAEMRSEQISPFVLYLASDLGKDVTGRIFGIHGQQIFEYKMTMTPGVTKKSAELWTPVEIGEKIEAIGKAKTAAPAAVEIAEFTPEQIVDKAFALIPDLFDGGTAGDWDGNIFFRIDGKVKYTLSVKDGKCEVHEGEEGTPTSTVTIASGTFADIVRGRIDVDGALRTGKIASTNLYDFQRFSLAVDLTQAQSALVPAAAPAAAAPEKGPKELTPKEIVDEAFKRLPEAFLPDKAEGWKAHIHFVVEGAGDYTVHVEDKTCTTSAGAEGEATCVVKTAVQTFADMVLGKIAGPKAFMEGKITANNMKDMIRFGQAFDMKRGAREAAKRAAAAEEPTPKEIVDEAFKRMPEAFLPDKAEGWKAHIHFVVEGAGDYTVHVEDKTCTTSAGAEGEATCVVKTTVQTFADMVVGKISGPKAFMEGKITANNMKDMVRYGQAFDMKRGAREAVKRAAVAAEVPPGLNREWIGRSVSGSPQFATPETMKAYALASNDPNPRYIDESREGGIIAPPLYPVRLFKDILFDILTDPDLRADLVRLVHGEQELCFYRPIKPWDLAALRAEVVGIEEKSSGELLKIVSRCYVDGQLAAEGLGSFFIRGPKKAGKKEKPPEPEEAEVVKKEITFRSEMGVKEDQTYRYAEAALDDNPIHVNPDVAAAAGLPGIILQGLCTMAFTSRAVIQEVLGGDPTKLKRLAVRFSKVVLPGDTLTTEGWVEKTEEGVTTLGFETLNQRGEVVITNGLAEVML
jgi:NAD(P)-dependent dehydrogenase (short-subunit alcohol dehydrogenase family)/acyl dehydratase/putative sterol carrier protein